MSVAHHIGAVKHVIAAVSLAVAIAPIASRAGGDPTHFTSAKHIEDHYAKLIVTAKDLDSDTKEYLRTHAKKGQRPGYGEIDLDGDGINDVAILTKGSEPDEAILRIFICKPKCTLVVNELVGSSDSTFLQPLEPGVQIQRTEALPGQHQVLKLKSGGVAVTNFGKAQQVYHWNEKKRSLDSTTTAD